MAYPETGDNSYILVYDKTVVSAEQAKTLEGTLEACKAANKKFIMDAGNGYYSCMFMFTGGLKINGLSPEGVQQFTDYDEDTVAERYMEIEYQDQFGNNTKRFMTPRLKSKPNKKMIECDVYQVKELPKKYKNKKYSQNAVAENFR